MKSSSTRFSRYTVLMGGTALIAVCLPLAAYGLPHMAASLVPAKEIAKRSAGAKNTSSTGASKTASTRFAPRAPGAGPIDTAPPVNPYNKRGIYLTSGSIARKDFFNDSMDALIKAGGSAIIFDVKGYNVYFQTDAAIANEIDTVHPVYDLPAVVAAAKAKGLYTMARFISLKDPQFTAKVPEAQVKNAKTGQRFGSTWADGSSSETLEYNRQILRDILKSGIDEVNLDYIRYSTEWPPSYYGLTGAEKADKILQFIKMVRQTIDEVAPQTKFGISTYAILGWNFPVNLEPLGQDFVKFAPYVDVISPMAYQDTFAKNEYYYPGKNPRSRPYWLVYRTLKGYKDLLPEDQKHKLRPWIQGYNVAAADMREEMDAVYDAGYCGFQVWSAGNKYTPTYAAMKNEGTRPATCKD
ncbi:MAG: hypothetical protein JWM56_989 [Candidatus Peribacteria bacterium]|nr:hypothetical protein [Candidatus Peribacteria bacterium]